MKLYTYYRSQASFRVRIALNLKGIAREDGFLHLEKGDQFAAAQIRLDHCDAEAPLVVGARAWERWTHKGQIRQP